MNKVNSSMRVEYTKNKEEYLKLKKEYRKIMNQNKGLMFKKNKVNAEY